MSEMSSSSEAGGPTGRGGWAGVAVLGCDDDDDDDIVFKRW